MLLYHFFDYKYNIPGFTSDLFGPAHICFIALAFLSTILLGIFLRNVSHKKFTTFLRVLSICVLVLEVFKIIWESYYDISTGRGFNTGGIIPIYTCSLLIYCLLISAWGKGMYKETSLSWLSTIGLVSGGIGVVMTNGLNYYPFWTFGGFYSMFFHYALLLTGVLILTTQYKILSWRDIYISEIPMLLLSIIASPINYYYGADYMQLNEGSGIPLFSSLADKLHELNMRPLFTFIMLASYMAISALVISIAKTIGFLCKYFKTKNQVTKDFAQEK